MLWRSYVVFRKELWEFWQKDVLTTIVIFVGMPLVFMAFLRPVTRVALFAAGVRGVNGSEQVVPGTAVSFGLFLVAVGSMAFFDERTWGTWERLRASSLSMVEILIGKAVAPLVIYTSTLVAIFASGGVLFHLRVRGSWAALALVLVSFATFLVALSFVLVAVSGTVQRFTLIHPIVAINSTGLGGAMIPLSASPAFVRYVAPAVPTYWAMRGFRAVLLYSGGLHDIALPMGVLSAFTLACFGLATVRLTSEDRRA